MQLQESGEMYLETIYILSQASPSVRSIDVAAQMGYSKPSVSRAIGILRQGGYLTMDAGGFLNLTPLGQATAAKVYERHTVLTALLKRLGVEETIAAEDACKIEHVISDTTFDAIKRCMDK